MHLIIKLIDGYVEEIDGNDDRYLVVSAVDNNVDVINKFTEICKDIKDKIFKISGKTFDRIEFGKIRFSSDIALPLNTLIKFHVLTVVIRCIIEKDGKYYLEICLDDALFQDNSIKSNSI